MDRIVREVQRLRDDSCPVLVVHAGKQIAEQLIGNLGAQTRATFAAEAEAMAARRTRVT